ncbi:MAG: T9SS type A sorting domain-containing protein, partial [Elusimicrobia bacterium]|nr:T9SS type A sorting domain-containing protein [Elusimicrobiota bacterium]
PEQAEWEYVTDNFANAGASYSKPRFCDIDADGDYDLFVGKEDGTVSFYICRPKGNNPPVEHEIAWDTQSVPGNSIHYKVKVEIDDGFNTGNDESDEYFTVDNSLAAPVMPYGFKGNAMTVDLIEWRWEDVSDESHFVIYDGATDEVLKVIPGDITQWLQDNLESNTWQKAYVKAGNKHGVSPATGVGSKCTFAHFPVGLMIGEITDEWFELHWNGRGASSYEFIYSSNRDFNPLIDTVSLFDQAIQIPNLNLSQEYWFKVRGFNQEDVPTAWSNIASTAFFKENSLSSLSLNVSALSISQSGILEIFGSTYPGSTIETITVYDSFDNALDLDLTGSITIDESGSLSGSVDMNVITSKYPLLRGIKLSLTINSFGHIQKAATDVILLEADKNSVTCFDNLFNPKKGQQALIRVEVGNPEHITIRLYDNRGSEILKLIDEDRNAGFHDFYWNGKNDSGDTVGSGVYLAQVQAGGFKEIKKLIVVK